MALEISLAYEDGKQGTYKAAEKKEVLLVLLEAGAADKLRIMVSFDCPAEDRRQNCQAVQRLISEFSKLEMMSSEDG